jgi:hypothetical protein
MDFIPMPTEFQFNKLLFLKNANYNETTKKAYWKFYLNYIADIEIEREIDLYNFSQAEINCYLDNVKDKSRQTISQVNSFINRYVIWYAEYYNKPLKSFKFEVKKEQDNSWYISKKDFFKLCNKMIKKNQNICSHIAPLIFARYGITGKELIHMRNIKWKDIDYNKKVVFIYNKDREKKLLAMSVDDLFLKWMTNLKKYNEEIYKDIKVNNEYVISTQMSNNIIANYNSINTKALTCFKSINMKRVSFKTLFYCGVVDYLDKFYSNIVPRNNDELMKTLLPYYPEGDIDLTKLRTIKKLYGEVFGNTELLNTCGRSRSKRPNREFKRSNVIYRPKNEENYRLFKDALRNKIIIKADVAYIIIEKSISSEKVKINIEFIEKIKNYKWYLNSSGYVVTRKKIGENLTVVHLSNFILEKEECYRIKYLNNDKLNCTIENLEVGY